MARPPLFHAGPQPVPPLNIEELKFWLDILSEHALFIKAGLPCDQTDLIRDAEEYYRELHALLARAEKIQSEKKFAELVAEACTVVRNFYRYKRHLVCLVITCKLQGHTFPLMLDHMAREAEYVLALLDKINDGKTAYYGTTKARETLFWLRIMEDHTHFIRHLLDPSERTFVATAKGFTDEFDRLYLEGRDFSSMLRQIAAEPPALGRFLQDVRASVIRLRDFKRAAAKLLDECKLLALIPPLLAEHVRREADHFLLVLAMMDKGMIVCNPEDDFSELHALVNEPATTEPVMMPDRPHCEAAECTEEQEHVYKTPKFIVPDPVNEPVEPLEHKPVAPPDIVEEPKPPKEPKHKWGKWPRPLGKTMDK